MSEIRKRNNMKIKQLLSVILILTFIVAFLLINQIHVGNLEQQAESRNTIINRLYDENIILTNKVQKLEDDINDLIHVQLDMIDYITTAYEALIELIGVEKEITAYAPLDDGAIEGMCYSGDPTITASGQKVVPNWTVAAGPNIPFNTLLWIEGIGLRKVNDRGGKITDNHIDVAVNTRQEAFNIGRSNRRVIIVKVGEN